MLKGKLRACDKQNILEFSKPDSTRQQTGIRTMLKTNKQKHSNSMAAGALKYEISAVK